MDLHPESTGEAPGSLQLICKAYLIEDPGPAIRPQLTGEVAPILQSRLTASEDGFGAYPDDYREYVVDLAERLNRLASDALALILWRALAVGGPPELNRHPGLLHWSSPPQDPGESLTDLPWRQIPAGVVSIGLPTIFALDVQDPIPNQVTAFLESRTVPPLGHDLLREAWRVRETNRRAALVVSVAALETGLKECVGTLAPDTSWLLENLPSPPLERMLKRFLPTLLSQAESSEYVPAVPSEIIKEVGRAVETRNRVMHGRSATPDAGFLDHFLITTRHLLYFFDFHCGHEWAAAGNPLSNK